VWDRSPHIHIYVNNVSPLCYLMDFYLCRVKPKAEESKKTPTLRIIRGSRQIGRQKSKDELAPISFLEIWTNSVQSSVYILLTIAQDKGTYQERSCTKYGYWKIVQVGGVIFKNTCVLPDCCGVILSVARWWRTEFVTGDWTKRHYRLVCGTTHHHNW